MNELSPEQRALFIAALCAVMCIDPSVYDRPEFSAADLGERILARNDLFSEFLRVTSLPPEEWQAEFAAYLLLPKEPEAEEEPAPVGGEPA